MSATSDSDHITTPGADVVYELTTRLTALEAKLDAHRGTLWSRIGAAAGMVALVISIFNGAFTLIDQVFSKPEEDRIAEYSALKTDIRTIISINEDLLSKAPTQAGTVPVAAMQAANIKIQSMMQDVERLLRMLGPSANDINGKYFIGSYDYSILAQAAYAGGNLRLAQDFANRAVDASDNFHTRSEALRSKAIIEFQVHGVSGVPAAEASLNQALDSLQSHSENGVMVDRAALLATKASIEAFAGQCADAHASADRSIGLVSGEDTPLQSRGYIATSIVNGLQGQQRCPLAGFSETIRTLYSTPTATAAAAPLTAAPAIVSPAAAPAADGQTTAKYSLVCRFRQGPRAGSSQSYAGVPGVTPVPVGTFCQDGQGSYGVAE